MAQAPGLRIRPTTQPCPWRPLGRIFTAADASSNPFSGRTPDPPVLVINPLNRSVPPCYRRAYPLTYASSPSKEGVTQNVGWLFTIIERASPINFPEKNLPPSAYFWSGGIIGEGAS